MRQLILGFNGKKQAGKDTLGDFLLRNKSYLFCCNSVKKYSFADPLKTFCMDYLGLTREQCYGTDKDKNSFTKLKWENLPHYLYLPEPRPTGFMTARQVLEEVGTGIMRRMYDNIWIDRLLKTIKEEKQSVAIVCDVRFPNEIKAIQQIGGKVIRLTRNIYTDKNLAINVHGRDLIVRLGGSNHKAEIATDPDVFDWNQLDAIIDNHNLLRQDTQFKLIDILLQWNLIDYGDPSCMTFDYDQPIIKQNI